MICHSIDDFHSAVKDILVEVGNWKFGTELFLFQDTCRIHIKPKWQTFK